MPIGRYRFGRADGIVGFMSTQRPSTNALNALGLWTVQSADRSFAVVQEADDWLVADLSWRPRDEQAGTSLDFACYRNGVERQRVEE